jgi:AbrB family looped-hinge helix DNA binding protein
VAEEFRFVLTYDEVMEQVTISSEGQISIPEPVRETLNLSEGTQLILEVRDQEIVLSREPAWPKLLGAAGAP